MLIGSAVVTNANLDLQFEIAVAVRQINPIGKLKTQNQSPTIAAIVLVQDWQYDQKRLAKILQFSHGLKEHKDNALNFKPLTSNQRNSLSYCYFKEHGYPSDDLNIKFYQPIFDAKSFNLNSKNIFSINESQFELINKTVVQIKEYVHGKRQYFNLPLDIGRVVDKHLQTHAQFSNQQNSLNDTPLAKHIGTPFQRSVWQQLLSIDYGSKINYATLAAQVGKPKAYRAVANANAQNRWTIVLPCHRVIASSGKIGGYHYGSNIKRQLLDLETHFS